MASLTTDNHSRKQMEERNLRLLRELASLPHNKHCFDCYQRGPTYVNMTIGSFVCTKCSGLLRGLNPPLRVKSICMATFTPMEIEFLRTRGNEYCKSIWTGRYTGSRGLLADGAIAKDDSQMKDYLIMKYEKKLWYVSPEEVAAKNNASKQLHPSPPESPLTVLSKSPNLFLKQSGGVKSQTPLTGASPASTNIVFDPFDDISADGSGSNNAQPIIFQQVLPKSATMPTGITASLPPTPGRAEGKSEGMTSEEKPCSVDKYAALAELDEMFHAASSSADVDLYRNVPGDTKPSAAALYPPHLTAYYAPAYPSNGFYLTPYSSFGQQTCGSTFGANPFPHPGALHQPPQWAYAGVATGYVGPGVNAGFPLAAQYAHSIVNNGMNPFMASAMMHQTSPTPRNPFL